MDLSDPFSAIESIEILRDSASAVYGADALGGVVNIKMRDDYSGAELEIGAEMQRLRAQMRFCQILSLRILQ